MTDTERVIKALECCSKGVGSQACSSCPYYNEIHCITYGMAKDALERLREAQKREEAIAPYEFAGLYKCGQCGNGIVGLRGREKEGFRYCPMCGKAVKWE